MQITKLDSLVKNLSKVSLSTHPHEISSRSFKALQEILSLPRTPLLEIKILLALVGKEPEILPPLTPAYTTIMEGYVKEGG